jgi:hypothetical protein
LAILEAATLLDYVELLTVVPFSGVDLTSWVNHKARAMQFIIFEIADEFCAICQG